MDVKTTKLDIIHRILDTDNERVLLLIRQLLEAAMLSSEEMLSENFWESLDEGQKMSIQLAIRQVEEGQGIPHASLMADVKQRFAR